jgi:hypothetical protein
MTLPRRLRRLLLFPASFLLALVLLACGLLYVDYNKYLFAERQPWLSHRLILSLVCLESWVCVCVCVCVCV